jgi:tripartite-type tricarboxylate transporter receptor subunit TctC
MTKITSTWLFGALTALALLGAPAASSQTASYPTRPIKIIVPSAPGGPADIIMRTINPKLAELLGQPVILEYRTGASGTIGLNQAARAAPDGYTLVFVSETHTAAESLYPKRGYKMTKDLTPIAPLVSQPRVLVVNKNLPVNSVQELLASAKAQPGKLSFASGGTGNVYHLAAELLQNQTGVKLLHVPYSQAGTGRTDLMSGQIDMMFDAVGAIMPQIQAGTVRALAVTSAKRTATMPNIPTLAESGVPGYEFESWSGLMAPEGTPPEIIAKLNKAVAESVMDKPVFSQFSQAAMVSRVESPAVFGEWIKTSIDKWTSLVRPE